ncbi:MAG: O-antigen ligase family protein [Anaerolineales bacterium]|nr:O-antigen ligase family protein [Anaerolineales bacterium]
MFTRRHGYTLFLLLLAAAALLGLGASRSRTAYETRGMPAGLPQPIAYGGATLGLNVYLQQYDDAELEQQLAAIAAAGFTAIKQPFYYQEPFDWAESDRVITAVSRHPTLTLIPLLDGNPANQFAPPADPNQFAAWAAAFASRYQLQFYIIWDEPNLTDHWGKLPPNANEYAALLATTAAAVRTADSRTVIVAAPLAPTVETGPANIADWLYLQQLYEAGAAEAFDIIAAKPYGFDHPPDDRTVNNERLNFSRVILLREVAERHGDGHKAIWAGNWGWNSLPADWQGSPSVWEETTTAQQREWTVAAFQRAQQEWPWLGTMFLENWQPAAPANDPRWGFSLFAPGSNTPKPLLEDLRPLLQPVAVAQPGFHLAQPDGVGQQFEGGWRFSPEFGADISDSGDRASFTFWGTDIGLRVRRADFRARLYVTVDGQPANALPRDENGTMLILTSPSQADDYVTTELVARNLPLGVHTVEIVASRGWDQWALNGWSVGYRPPNPWLWQLWLGVTAVFALLLALHNGRLANWGPIGRAIRQAYERLAAWAQWGLTAVAALIVAVMGWLTWGTHGSGLYRRLGDVGQIALTAATAALFYVTPNFILFTLALILLFLLIYLRPAWGLALIALCFPFYINDTLKPIFVYRFSPVEIFTIVTFLAVIGHQLCRFTTASRTVISNQLSVTSRQAFTDHRLLITDYCLLLFLTVATLSLPFTERLNVASNEWRVVIMEPALFYVMLRLLRPTQREMWVILDAFVLGAVAVALIGLGQYVTGYNLITAEGGLLRLRAHYGSPNNVALYFGRVIPLLAAMVLLGKENGRRRWGYAAAAVPIGLAMLLTFSKGGLLLGVPAGLLVVFWQWQRQAGRRTWPWLLAAAIVGAAGLLGVQQIPQLAERFNVGSATAVFRLNLWQASLEMVRQHPWFGVGLDNFLYAYRGRYILDAAWQEPNLNHPHNIILDFATRLGLLGLLAGTSLFASFIYTLRRACPDAAWRPVVVGMWGSLAAILTHGLVDHSFFLVDLAFVFYLLLGTAIWLTHLPPEN